MELLRYGLRFVFRHLLWLTLGPLAIGSMVLYLSKGWIGPYEVNTTVYTGVTSNTSTGDGTTINASVANTNLENLITIIRSRATLERVSMRLFAQSLIYGDREKDNTYISAASFRELESIVPERIKGLIDKTSLDQSVENLFENLKPEKANFLYGILNWYHAHYSINALKKINVRRIPGSDMVDITYTANDPAIAFQTLEILNKEFITTFSELRYKDSNEIIRFFEREVAAAKGILSNYEDSLLAYRMERRIVNYEEQTEALMALDTDHYITLKQLLINFAAAQSALLVMELQLQGRENLYVNNTNFMALMKDISALSAAMVRAESLMPDTLKASDPKLQYYRQRMDELTAQLKTTSLAIRQNQGTKEGMPVESVLLDWLKEKVEYEKAKASIEVMTKEQDKLDNMYTFFSPIGASLKRKDREINVAEQTYLQLTQALISARLRLKNLEMSLGNVAVVTPPVYPLDSLPTKRRILAIASTFAAFVLILCFFLILELIDRTLRTVFRTGRLLGEPVDGAIPQVNFSAEADTTTTEAERDALRAASAHLASELVQKIHPNQPGWIVVGSHHPGDGKSLLCRLLEERFSELGFTTRWIRPGEDYAYNTKSYFAADSPQTLMGMTLEQSKEDSVDLYLIELPPSALATFPGRLLAGAVSNLLVCDAGKGWQFAEHKALMSFKALSCNNIMIVLNRSSLDDMELFTSLLPPRTWFRKLRFRIMNLELTSRWSG